MSVDIIQYTWLRKYIMRAGLVVRWQFVSVAGEKGVCDPCATVVVRKDLGRVGGPSNGYQTVMDDFVYQMGWYMICR